MTKTSRFVLLLMRGTNPFSKGGNLMFYVKENINDAMEVTVEINDENVFCHCPRCGAEVPVDLNEFFGDAEFDLFGTAICCTECSRKVRCEK